MDRLTSIEELNSLISKPPNLSPTSKEASRKLGILPEELVHKPLSHFLKKSNTKETAEIKFNQAEKIRLEKIQ